MGFGKGWIVCVEDTTQHLAPIRSGFCTMRRTLCADGPEFQLCDYLNHMAAIKQAQRAAVIEVHDSVENMWSCLARERAVFERKAHIPAVFSGIVAFSYI
jgi:hypothetical protein